MKQKTRNNNRKTGRQQWQREQKRKCNDEHINTVKQKDVGPTLGWSGGMDAGGWDWCCFCFGDCFRVTIVMIGWLWCGRSDLPLYVIICLIPKTVNLWTIYSSFIVSVSVALHGIAASSRSRCSCRRVHLSVVAVVSSLFPRCRLCLVLPLCLTSVCWFSLQCAPV